MKDCKKICKNQYGREEGIRTLEGLHLTRVPGVLLQPLGHLSKKLKSKKRFSKNPAFYETEIPKGIPKGLFCSSHFASKISNFAL